MNIRVYVDEYMDGNDPRFWDAVHASRNPLVRRLSTEDDGFALSEGEWNELQREIQTFPGFVPGEVYDIDGEGETITGLL